MSSRHVCAIFLAGAALIAATPPPQATPGRGPTTTAPAATAPARPKIPADTAEIQQAIDRGEYASAVSGISRLLAPSHPVDYDRHLLLMLRAECELQLKQTTQSISTLEGIRKVSHENAVIHDEYEALAMIFLIHKSPALTYTPKSGASRIPISILERTRRKELYNDLFTDEFAIVQKLSRDAAFDKKLDPVVAVCDQLLDVQSAEYVATGAIGKSRGLAVQMLGSARIAFSTLLRNYDAQVDQIASSRPGRGPFRGVNQGQSKTLNEIVYNCNLIADLIRRLRILADQPEALSRMLAYSEGLKQNAELLLAGNTIEPLGPLTEEDTGTGTTVNPGRGRGRAGRGVIAR